MGAHRASTRVARHAAARTSPPSPGSPGRAGRIGRGALTVATAAALAGAGSGTALAQGGPSSTPTQSGSLLCGLLGPGSLLGPDCGVGADRPLDRAGADDRAAAPSAGSATTRDDLDAPRDGEPSSDVDPGRLDRGDLDGGDLDRGDLDGGDLDREPAPGDDPSVTDGSGPTGPAMPPPAAGGSGTAPADGTAGETVRIIELPD